MSNTSPIPIPSTTFLIVFTPGWSVSLVARGTLKLVVKNWKTFNKQLRSIRFLAVQTSPRQLRHRQQLPNNSWRSGKIPAPLIHPEMGTNRVATLIAFLIRPPHQVLVSKISSGSE